jgi:hypothetical protein
VKAQTFSLVIVGIMAMFVAACSNPFYREPCVPDLQPDVGPHCIWWNGDAGAALADRHPIGSSEHELVAWLHGEGFTIEPSETSEQQRAVYESSQDLLFCEPRIWNVLWSVNTSGELTALQAMDSGLCMVTP